MAAHRRVAYVAGEPFLWPALTSAETFEFLARLHGGTDVAYRELLVERFQLDPNKKIRALSKGNRQKVQLIAALATRAELLLLDEPTSGLDPLMEVAFRDCVQEAKERGQTVFLSSHILSEVEALCDRVGILRDGKLVDEGTLAGAAPPRRADGRGHVRRPGARAPGAAGRAGPERRPERAALRGLGQRRPADRGARRASGGDADQPRALARGDLPAPLRRLRRTVSATSSALPCAAPRAAPAGSRAVLALARRAFRDARIRTISFAYLFALYAYIQPVGYRDAYPTLADRLAFAHSFANNEALRLFYGYPYDLLSVSGYTAWRVGGTLAIFAAVFGLLAAVRALRTEEDAGRMELVLAGIVGAAHGVPLGAGRDRGGRRAAVARGVRRGSRGRAAGRRLGLSRAGDGVGRAGVRRAWARWQASSRRRAGSRSSSAARSSALSFLLRVIADTASGVDLAALGDAAWMGRGAASVRRRRAARAGPPDCQCRTAALARGTDRRQP